MVKKDRTRDLDLRLRVRFRNLYTNREALDPPQMDEEMRQLENTEQITDSQAAIAQMQEDYTEDFKMEYSDDGDESEHVGVDDHNNTELGSDRKLIDEMTMQLDRVNLGPGYKEQMNSYLHHCSRNDTIKRRRNEFKTIIQWLKEANKSNEIEEYVLELGAQFSLIVVDFSVFMLGRKDLKAKFQEFKSSVETLSIGDNGSISRKLFNLLEIAEAELNDTKELSKNESAAMGKEYSHDRSERTYKERLVGEMVEQFLEKLDCLGRICGAPCPKEPLMSAMEVSLAMKNILVLFQKEMIEVKNKLSKLKRIFCSSAAKNEDRKLKGFWKKMDVMIRHQFWNRLEES